MSPGAMCPMETSLAGAGGSDRSSEFGSKVGSSVGFLLGSPGSGVCSEEEGSLRDSWGVYSLS